MDQFIFNVLLIISSFFLFDSTCFLTSHVHIDNIVLEGAVTDGYDMTNSNYYKSTCKKLSNLTLSTPVECSRTCKDYELPKICYYKFTLEYYNVLGSACEICRPNSTNSLQSTCQCVLADGVERSFLSVNRMLPGPRIEVCQGDKVIVDVSNRIPGLEAAIHWHVMLQRGSQFYDGVPYVTQCPIPEGTTFRYQWIAENDGTHFWHSHIGFHKLDGLAGSLVVRRPKSQEPNGHLYDFDLPSHLIFISDWLHEYSAESFPGHFMQKDKRGQFPKNILVNGKGHYMDYETGKIFNNTALEEFIISPGKRYRFRLINAFGMRCPATLTIQNHSLTVIAIDGEPVQPVVVDTIISMAGERYDFVINAKEPIGSYWIQFRDIDGCTLKGVQQLSILRYVNASTSLTSQPTYNSSLRVGIILNPVHASCNIRNKDVICINQLRSATPVREEILTDEPDLKLYLPFDFYFLDPADFFKPNTYQHFLAARDGSLDQARINNISYVPPTSPLISQINDIPPGTLCNEKSSECKSNCLCTHVIDVPLDAVVEIILINNVAIKNLSHPFHLHGQVFFVLGMGISDNGQPLNVEQIRDMDKKGILHRNFQSPPSKDTIQVQENGYVIIRFKANNPGFWMLHCHILFHMDTGMSVILHVGQQNDLPPVPDNFPKCGDYLPPIEPI